MSAQEDFERWRNDGAALLAKLERERDDKLSEIGLLEAEVVKLDESITLLVASLDVKAKTVGEKKRADASVKVNGAARLREIRISDSQPLTDVVRAVLRVSDAPMTARAVIDEVNGIRTAKADEVHRALYRLKELDEIDITGERPARLYALKEGQHMLSLAK